MKYVLAEYDTGYNSGEEIFAFTDNVTDEEIENEVKCAAEEFFDDYSFGYTGWDNDFANDDDEAEYYDGCSYSWDYIDEEEYKANS